MLRNLVYGEETHRQRSYFRDGSTKEVYHRGLKSTVPSGVIFADKKRRTYKHLKKIYTQIKGLSPIMLQKLSDGLPS
jgi:hypothetical protein